MTKNTSQSLPLIPPEADTALTKGATKRSIKVTSEPASIIRLIRQILCAPEESGFRKLKKRQSRAWLKKASQRAKI